MIINNNSGDYENHLLPECSPAFLGALKKALDIRKKLYEKEVSLDYLRGIQYVLDTIEYNNKTYHENEEEDFED